jgi:hypothetical protein
VCHAHIKIISPLNEPSVGDEGKPLPMEVSFIVSSSEFSEGRRLKEDNAVFERNLVLIK